MCRRYTQDKSKDLTISSISRRNFLIAAAALASGCTPAPRKEPPLEELYQHLHHDEQPPLIIIPGVFGSKLLDTKTNLEIWPRSSARMLFSKYESLEVDIDESTLEPAEKGIKAYEIFRKGLGRDFNGKILDTLEGAGGYTRRWPGQQVKAGQRNYYVYLYDWRLDNVAAVKGLHEMIEQIRADYRNADLKVDILAHSNGGLLARYYARYGDKDYLDNNLAEAPITYAGASSLRRLLIVGTPNLGSMQPVLSHVRGEEIGFKKIPAEIVATIPGAPQLMPHPAIPWLIDVKGNVLEKDVFDIQTWRDFNWSIFDEKVINRITRRKGGQNASNRYLDVLQAYLEKHLNRGRNFMLLLSKKSDERDIKPYVFGGDCDQTLARLVLEEQRGKLLAREHPETILNRDSNIDYFDLMFDPGDSVVTRSSLLGNYERTSINGISTSLSMYRKHSVFICEKHQLLTGNPMFQNNLLHTLFNKNTS